MRGLLTELHRQNISRTWFTSHQCKQYVKIADARPARSHPGRPRPRLRQGGHLVVGSIDTEQPMLAQWVNTSLRGCGTTRSSTRVATTQSTVFSLGTPPAVTLPYDHCSLPCLGCLIQRPHDGTNSMLVDWLCVVFLDDRGSTVDGRHVLTSVSCHCSRPGMANTRHTTT